ncbi:hypothetical protein KC19_3G032600 [Ceratodon purpureus]|uniref:Glyoxal oxidase N-terminal domain-containing protein n=1 Tax=Ceratodon purpureus TaxID=3225 RepID=A0A8T0IGY0_CERPU|nr:hypothetical protein KC19_3G032600 [Ceratodon purpureus]
MAGVTGVAAMSVLVMVMVVQMVAMMGVTVEAQGSWAVLQKNAGIASMHSAVSHFDQVIMLDRTNIGPSAIKLPGGRCRKQPLERVSKTDCYAHSVMFNPNGGGVRPLYIFTDTWCSSGQFFDNGVLVQTGGDFEGNKVIRTLAPCGAGGNCDWVETGARTTTGRWYASNALLPSGTRQIIVGGRDGPNYEFYPKRFAGEGSFYVPMLGGQDTLYPYVILLPNGNVFFFAGRKSVQINWNNQKTVRTYPDIPGPNRNYPSAGSSTLLPLTWQNNFGQAEVMVCGGAAGGAAKANNVNAPAVASCGRMVMTAANAGWAMSNMPIRRTMGDMINTPDGQVVIINGAQNGFQGWGKANNPALNPVSYNPGNGRYAVLAKTNIPRLYHSTANLLSDGRILVAGSNTHQFYTYTGAFPTELRVEAYSPAYLGAGYVTNR